jgi:hypothetical protein
MPITLERLDIRRPALAEAAAYLERRFVRGSELDLSAVIVVTPGGRAGRRLLEILVDRAAERQLVFSPPRIETIGRLPELLYSPKFPFASPLTQQLAWARALRGTAPEALRALLPQPPGLNLAADADPDVVWLEFGDVLRRAHTELIADEHEFASVARKVGPRAGAAEEARWRTLADIQSRYLSLLDSLELWDQQTARLEAVRREEFTASGPLVLIGTVDLNRTQRAMLEQVADHTTVLVSADRQWDLATAFDSHGCLQSEAWNDPACFPIPLDDRHFHQVEGPTEQAEEIVRQIAAWNGRYRADEITIGFPDEPLAADVERQLRQCGQPARWGAGRPVAETTPYRLLTAIGQWLERPSFAEWAQLLRHPDISAWLLRVGIGPEWIQELDEYHATHLPTQLGPGALLGPPDAVANLIRARDAVQNWLEPLGQDTRRSLEEWANPLFRVLASVYDREFRLGDVADAATWRACQRLRRGLEEFEKVPAPLRPRTTAAEAIQWVLRDAAFNAVPPPVDPEAIELVGWLELALDDAPALIVTSFNDGLVPKSVNADPFLPNALRTLLKIDDNARRYARDAYALWVLAASRAELRLLVARRNAAGDPQPPSRLLFAADDVTVARRARRLFDPPPAAPRRGPLPGEYRPTLVESAFEAPAPEWIMAQAKPGLFDEPLRMSVSDFKSYLECPQRFLLRRAGRLEEANDTARELDGGAFGSLAHAVLSDFGREALGEGRTARWIDPDRLADFLRERLRKRGSELYGAAPRPAVQLQLAQLRSRLDAFAKWQAERAREGWFIAHVEEESRQEESQLEVDGQPFRLVGRIDRIDRHTRLNQWELLDYKTGDAGDSPQKTHYRKGRGWIDLQLPLYRHLARSKGLAGHFNLGYILLPKDISKTGAAMAAWDEQKLAEADEQAREVVRRVRRREFAPEPSFRSGPYDSLARICLAGVMGK